MNRHYTLNILTLLFLALGFTGCFNAQAQSYSLYQECDEYYDSRGFYHKKCPVNEFDKKEAVKTYKRLLDDVQPGKGLEDNTTKKDKLASTIDTIIEDDTADEPNIDQEKSESKTPALREKPVLEFGRE